MDYSKTKIYKIWSPNGDKIYIGSTCKKYLSQRMHSHRNNYNQWKINKQKFITSYLLFDEYGIENCFIELIEEKPCSSKDEKNQLEGHYIRTLICVNKCVIGRTKKESNNVYYEKNKEICNEKHKIYIQNNKEQIYETNKQYRIKNNEQVKLNKKEYYNTNKDIINEKRKEQITCSCGCSIRKDHLKQHQQTKKHLSLIKLD